MSIFLRFVRNEILDNFYLHDKLLIVKCACALLSLREPPKLSNWQIWWFFRSCTIFLDLTGQCFDRNKSCQKQRYEQLWIRIKLSRIHSFHSKSLWSWQNSAILQKKIVFWSTLAAPREKTVYLREFNAGSKLFITLFLTTFISIKTVSGHI